MVKIPSICPKDSYRLGGSSLMETSSKGDGMTLLLHQSIVVEIGELASNSDESLGKISTGHHGFPHEIGRVACIPFNQ